MPPSVSTLPASSYSDGEAVEREILDLIEASRSLDSDAAPIDDLDGRSWPVRYHLSPERANLLRHLRFDDLSVLELGAGMGGVSRFLAERAAHLTAVESSERRLEGATARLEGLASAQAVLGSAESVELDRFYDVVCLIGVLEYAELYVEAPTGVDPFVHLLDRASRHLAPGGVLLLAIENRLGAKYWTGAAEDHVGRPFFGLAGYPQSPSVRTFSRRELLALLRSAGWMPQRLDLPFPDYKMPTCVLRDDLADRDPELATDLACFRTFSDPERPRVHLYSDYLVLDGLARAGMFADMANSFLVFATREARPLATYRKLTADSALAWHYSPARAVSTRTRFVETDEGTLEARKTAIGAEAGGRAASNGVQFPERAFGTAPNRVFWRPELEPVAPGTRLRHTFLRRLAYEEEAEFFLGLAEFLRRAIERFQVDAEHLQPEAVDAIWRNATLDGDALIFFDLEWRTERPVLISWWILRNVLAFADDLTTLPARKRPESLRGLYRELCAELGIEPSLDADLEREVEFAHVVGRQSVDALRRRIRSAVDGLPPAERGGALLEASSVERQEDSLRRVTRAIGLQDASLRSVHEAMSHQETTLAHLHEALVGHDRALAYLKDEIDAMR
ncbi:MAG: class I SAM-dependent methyltransferase, partial [Acidobacteriota bacterium]